MTRTQASAPEAIKAYEIVSHLQNYFVTKLNAIGEKDFEPLAWFRDEGRHGGGVRYEARDEELFNRASVNISQVHYDDDPDKKLSSATAISTIIHPLNPHAPSMHMHISWTQMRDGKGYWRIMADLNPAIPYAEDTKQFTDTLTHMGGDYAKEALAQGDRYFYIPALKRHRGVSHFYLEDFHSEDTQADEAFAYACGEAVINTYIALLKKHIHQTFTPEDKRKQLDYHTLYLLQVLTLDRGTTSGLLVHNQNDIGILGSLPSHVDSSLLQSWLPNMPHPQEKLLSTIIDTLPNSSIMIDTKIKSTLAQCIRQHYQTHPEALSLQASGHIIPPTVQNHT